jgi:hypothetical protein
VDLWSGYMYRGLDETDGEFISDLIAGASCASRCVSLLGQHFSESLEAC